MTIDIVAVEVVVVIVEVVVVLVSGNSGAQGGIVGVAVQINPLRLGAWLWHWRMLWLRSPGEHLPG